MAAVAAEVPALAPHEGAQEMPEEGGDEYDARYEFDAPRFYDFQQGSPLSGPAADSWFETAATRGLATPTELPQQPQPQEPEPAGASPQPTSKRRTPRQRRQSQPAQEQAAPPGKERQVRQALAPIVNAAPQPAGKSAASAPAAGASSAAAAEPVPLKPAPQAPAPATQQAEDPGGSKDAAADVARARAGQEAGPSMRIAAASGKPAGDGPAAAATRPAPRRTTSAAARVPAAAARRPATPPAEQPRMHLMETRSMAKATPWKSMAQRLAEFEGRTAAAATRPRAEPLPPPAGNHGAYAQHLTHPKSPKFATRQRARPPRFKPREVVEAEQMAAMPKFKARPFNKKIMRSRQSPPAPPKRQCTEPEPFRLKTDARAVEHIGAAHAAAAGRAAVAAAPPQQALDGGRTTRSQAYRRAAPLTQPKPFSFKTDARSRKRVASPHEEAAPPHDKAGGRSAKRQRR